MKKSTKVLMAMSGVIGLSLFLIINFTTVLGPNVYLAAALQLSANTFVFLSWLRGFKESEKVLQRVVTGIGFTVPLCMASITLIRVVIYPLLT